MNNKNILEALSMDLKRIALGLHRGSLKTAERFMEEAILRKKEIDATKTKKYILKLLEQMEKSFQESDIQKKAEDALMFSTRFQNAALAMKS